MNGLQKSRMQDKSWCVGKNGNISIKPVEEKEVFSLAEVRQFIKLLDELPDDLIYRRVTLKFVVLTGVRTAELHGLRWADFDFDKRIVHIRRNRLATEGFGIYEKDPKSRTSKRDIPLPAELMDDLKSIWIGSGLPTMNLTIN